MKKEEVSKIKNKSAKLKRKAMFHNSEIEALESRNAELENAAKANGYIIFFIVIGMSVLLGLSQAGLLN